MSLTNHRRVPAVYPCSAFLAFLSVLRFRRISDLRAINTASDFDSRRLHLFGLQPEKAP